MALKGYDLPQVVPELDPLLGQTQVVGRNDMVELPRQLRPVHLQVEAPSMGVCHQ